MSPKQCDHVFKGLAGERRCCTFLDERSADKSRQRYGKVLCECHEIEYLRVFFDGHKATGSIAQRS
jgi:hypothetical protein